MEEPATGAWIAYYSDMSAVYVFGSELDALRWAVDNSGQVKFVAFGESV